MERGISKQCFLFVFLIMLSGAKQEYRIDLEGSQGDSEAFYVEIDKDITAEEAFDLDTSDDVVDAREVVGTDYSDDDDDSQNGNRDPTEDLINIFRETNGKGADYSGQGPCDFCKKITVSILVSSIMMPEQIEVTKDFGGKTFKICKPKSLKELEEKKGFQTSKQIKDGLCDVQLVDIAEETGSDTRSGNRGDILTFEQLEKKLNLPGSPWENFPRGTVPPTQDLKFKQAVHAVVKLLLEEKDYSRYLSVLAFLKNHPKMNEILLGYSVVGAGLKRNDTSRIILSPLEDTDPAMYLPTKKTKSKTNNDYANAGPLFIDDATNYNIDPKISFTHDQEESKWDYFREDPLLHVFHSLYHKVFENTYPASRIYERFYYMHGQLIRRGLIERRCVGLPDVVPLDENNFRLSLGPGYETGYFGWRGVSDRPDGCVVKQEDIPLVNKLFNPGVTLEDYCRDLTQSGYHSGGHLAVANCSLGNGYGPMRYAECSARDPTFWRWHEHVENLVVQRIHEIMPKYTRADFELTDGVAVKEVFTTSQILAKNTLVTFYENATISFAERSTLSYRRLNHRNFSLNVKIHNPSRVKKKVIVRLLLGLSSSGSYNGREVIAMDRFVYQLKGTVDEEIQRESSNSALTMKESGMTINRLAKMIQDYLSTGSSSEPETFCGFPHNLYLPSGKPKGQNFELLAFVNDVRQDSTEGSDGVEHILCGHKQQSIVMDERLHGFPFDRTTDFDLETFKGKVFAQTTIRITNVGEASTDEEIIAVVGTTPTVTPSGGNRDRDITEESSKEQTVATSEAPSRGNRDGSITSDSSKDQTIAKSEAPSGEVEITSEISEEPTASEQSETSQSSPPATSEAPSEEVEQTPYHYRSSTWAPPNIHDNMFRDWNGYKDSREAVNNIFVRKHLHSSYKGHQGVPAKH